MKRLLLCLVGFTLASVTLADDAGQLLSGVIDVHTHVGPDSMPRSIDAIDLARLEQKHGMRGMIIKSHYEPTASIAYLVRKEVPGFEAFGGVDLNLSVGGMNPSAVEHMANITGGWGRIVWMATFDAEAQVRHAHESRPFVSVSRNGQLLPETKAVIAALAKHHLVMATGHNTGAEDLMLIREAERQGVDKIIVTHAMMAPIHMTTPQMQEAAKLGAYIEFVYNGLIGGYKEFEFKDYVNAIRAVGPDHCILSSDMGQTVNPVHPDGLVLFFEGLEKAGITPGEIAVMAKRNPARLLSLPETWTVPKR